jgi:hypothetical protein
MSDSVISLSARINGLSAEHHLGIVGNSKGNAAENLLRLNAAMRAAWPGGSYATELAVDGITTPPLFDGPILEDIMFSGKQFFYKGVNHARSQIILPKKTGISLIGVGKGSVLGDQNFDEVGDIGTRFTRLDPEDGDTTYPYENGSFVLMRGNGAFIKNIQFNGRHLPGNINSAQRIITNITNANPAVLTTDAIHGAEDGSAWIISGVDGTLGAAVNGTVYVDAQGNTNMVLYSDPGLTTPINTLGLSSWATSSDGDERVNRPLLPCCFTVEGSSSSVSTGKNRIEDCGVFGCDTVVRALSGEFDANGENFDETFNHADHTVLQGIRLAGCSRFFHSLNNQSQNWIARDIQIIDASGVSTSVLIDLELGGNTDFEFTNVGRGTPMTLYRLHEYRKNARRNVAKFYRDGGSGEIFKLVEYMGGIKEAGESDWSLRITGHLSGELPDPNYFDIVDGSLIEMDPTDIWFDVSRAQLGNPPSGYQYVASGPGYMLEPTGSGT